MMNSRVNNIPCIIEIGKKFYECSYDHENIDILETFTGLGFYEIYEKFIISDDLSANVLINIISLSVYKKYGMEGVYKLKSKLLANSDILLDEFINFKVMFKNLLPDMKKFREEMNSLSPNKMNSIPSVNPFYDFEGNYAVARKYLLWSDNEFWSATPRKFCFALLSTAKYINALDKYSKQLQTQECINLLNGIKNLI